jgi:hypothetical protein
MSAEIVYSLAFGSPDHRWCENPVSVSVSNIEFDTHSGAYFLSRTEVKKPLVPLLLLHFLLALYSLVAEHPRSFHTSLFNTSMP